MIAVLGDLHGDVAALFNAHDAAVAQGCVALVQLGDFGFGERELLRAIAIRGRPPEIPIWLIDGNHDPYPEIQRWWGYCRVEGHTSYTIAPNIFYATRGSLGAIDNRKIVFFGGAGSVDKRLRLAQRLPWYPEEEITEADVDRMTETRCDLLVTHTPPQSVIDAHNGPGQRFDKRNLPAFCAPVTWRDPSAERIERVWQRLGQPPILCGHMHASLTHGNVRILGIGELAYV